MKKLGAHQHRGGPRPSFVTVLKHVETSTNPDNHWEWEVDGADRRFDRNGQAVLHAKTLAWLPKQIFYVARLLLDHIRGPFPPRSSFMCRCGFPGCVNPGHWTHVLPPVTVRLQPQLMGWIPVHVRTGKPIAQNTPLIVHAGDAITHVLIASPVVASTFRTLCGLDVYTANIVVHPRGDLVTCKKGCA